MTDLDPRLQFLIDYECAKLDWMDEGPRKQQAEHMAKIRILSMPWQDMLDLYAKTKWEENHGRIRVTQKFAVINGERKPTSYSIEQNVHGRWTEIPKVETEEDDQDLTARFQKLADEPWWR